MSVISETPEQMERHRMMVDEVENRLRRCKCCDACANAQSDLIDDIIPCYQVICKITGENRKGRSGAFCKDWK
jgi:CCR4-NOT transcriptional regulation complex NOT5 subunit